MAQSRCSEFVWRFLSTAGKQSFFPSMIKLLEQHDVKMTSMSNAECKKKKKKASTESIL